MKGTVTLIVICVLVSLVYWYSYPDLVEEYLIYSGDRAVQGAVWTPITTLFVHADLLHLVGNMLFLYVFGMVVEKEAGARMTLVAFLVGGIGSLIVSSFYYGFETWMIGASGAIFTLAAAAMLIRPLKLSLFFLFIPLGLVAILYFIFNVLAVTYEVGGNVGYVAHVAGFIIGIPFGISFSKGEWAKNLVITMLLLVIFLAIIFAIQVLL